MVAPAFESLVGDGNNVLTKALESGSIEILSQRYRVYLRQILNGECVSCRGDWRTFVVAGLSIDDAGLLTDIDGAIETTLCVSFVLEFQRACRLAWTQCRLVAGNGERS